MWARMLGASSDIIATFSEKASEECKQTFVCKRTRAERKQSSLLNFDYCSKPQEVWVKGVLTI